MTNNQGILSLLGHQVVIRLAITAMRFGIAAYIISKFGVGIFGGYALVLSILLIGETLVDFGITDWLARAITIKPKQSSELLYTCIKTRIGLIIFSGLSMALIVYFIPGLKEFQSAVLLALLALPLYMGILYFRSLLKAHMRMDLEVYAELCGLILASPLYFSSFIFQDKLLALVSCYLTSRALFLLFLCIFARKQHRVIAKQSSKKVASLIKEVSPLGISMLLVCLHGALDPILVGAFLDSISIGHLAGSQRIIFLMALLLVPLSDLLLPLLSHSYKHNPEEYSTKLQTGGLIFALISGGVFAGFFSGSSFLLGLLGGEMNEANSLFRLLCVASLLKGASLITGPAILAAGRFKWVLMMTASLVLMKCILLPIFISHFGLIGAGYAMIFSELINLVICLILVNSVSNQPIKSIKTIGVILSALLSVFVISHWSWDGHFIAGVLSGVLFLILVFLSRMTSVTALREIIQQLKPLHSDELL